MLRQWDFYFAVERNVNTPIHSQIIQKIISLIKAGQFKAGMAMPGSRELAISLNVNRKTVIHAYDELIAEGWLESSYRKGTFIAQQQKVQTSTEKVPSNAIQLNTTTKSEQHTEVSTIDFRCLSSLYFPVASTVLSKAYRQASLVANKNVGQQNYNQSLELRNLIAKTLLIEKSLSIQPTQLLTLPNREIALSICATKLKHENEYILVAQNSRSHVIDLLKTVSHSVLLVKTNAHGIDLLDLEKLCINYNVKLLYLSTDSNVYKSELASEHNRNQLIQLASRFSFNIIEDDCQSALSAKPSHNTLLQQIDTTGCVTYISTICDWILPDLSVAYIASSLAHIEQCSHYYHHTLKQSNRINDLALLSLIKQGEIRKHLKRTRRKITQKIEFTLTLINARLAEYMIGFARLDPLHNSILLKLKHVDTRDEHLSELMHQNALAFSVTNEPEESNNQINLHFLHLSEDEILIGIARLEKLLKHFLIPTTRHTHNRIVNF